MEVRNRVVGMLSLSSNVNYTLLNHHFELVPFYGLRQPDERDKITLPAVARTDSQESLHFTESELTIYSSILGSLHTAQYRLGYGMLPWYTRRELSVVLEDMEESKQSTEEEELKESPSDDMVIVNDPTSTMFEKVFEQVESVRELAQPEEEEHISSENSIINKIRNTAMNMLADSAPPEIKTKTHMKILPSYHGLPNAFLVELFMMAPDQDDRLSMDFLEAAFECYPDMEYCIISLPCSYPAHPTLQHFVMATPRSGSSFEHELYVVHRNSVLRMFFDCMRFEINIGIFNIIFSLTTTNTAIIIY
ncbi:unnamed protein product [Timema podura]|uniref:Uncharacterized protein n=1 Tax=Timema podura TaxID=61482 RepID=A0ABN7NMP9_TIMPD|nr:unnamed protein product [Timema podura]